MRSLEEITRDLFTSFSERKIGKRVRWDLLTEERQIDWVEDTYFIIDEALKLLEKEMNTNIPDKQPTASFESGMLAGIKREQTRYLMALKNMREKYLEDLKDFVE